jgi:hypothetical protein
MKSYTAISHARPIGVRREHHDISAKSHFVVPGGTGLVFGSMAGIIALRCGAGMDSLTVGALVWIAAFAGTLYCVFRFGGSLETVFGDLNGDGYIGDPPPVRHVTAFDVGMPRIGAGGESRLMNEFALHPEQIAEQFRIALADDGRPGRHGVLSFERSTLERSEWDAFTETLRLHQLMQFKNGRRENGHELTDRGRIFMQAWLSERA